MNEREEGLKVYSASDLFSASSKMVHSGVLVEHDRTSIYKFIGSYLKDGKIRPISLSYSKFVGSEIIEISTEGLAGKITKVDQPNTSPPDEYIVEGIARLNFPEILPAITPDKEAMRKLSSSRTE